MNDVAAPNDQYAQDCAVTLRNRANLMLNGNLLYWYRKLYHAQLSGFRHPETLRILEVGSGVSPLKRFYKNVRTSDILELEYLDYVFDCHLIDQFGPIADESLDLITLTNVLHHLESPIEFLNKAAIKLKRGAKIIATEPFFSTLSTPIFRYLHHEPVDFDISEPTLSEVRGPLASANIALPWLIFQRPDWSQRLRARYEFDFSQFQFFSSLSYVMTGGISRQLPIPSFLYRPFFHLDMILSRLFPRTLASFFTITLVRK